VNRRAHLYFLNHGFANSETPDDATAKVGITYPMGSELFGISLASDSKLISTGIGGAMTTLARITKCHIK
jgi:hypothetical protein